MMQSMSMPVAIPDSLDAPARAAALGLAGRMARFWERRLGADLLGVYLIGSLAHGGFSRRYSDIDMLVLAEQGVSADDQAAMRGEAASVAPDLAGKLSLFWSDRACAIGRFPPLDRLDYIDRPQPLLERTRIACPRPSLGEIRTYLAGAPFANWAERARSFAAADSLAASDRKPFIRALLYPARFVYSWKTGDITSNDLAVVFLSNHAPPGFDRDLVARALALRQQAADPDPLWPERGELLQQVESCERLMAG
jgi:predicted nucleotidyltransferase